MRYSIINASLSAATPAQVALSSRMAKVSASNVRVSMTSSSPAMMASRAAFTLINVFARDDVAREFHLTDADTVDIQAVFLDRAT